MCVVGRRSQGVADSVPGSNQACMQESLPIEAPGSALGTSRQSGGGQALWQRGQAGPGGGAAADKRLPAAVLGSVGGAEQA